MNRITYIILFLIVSCSPRTAINVSSHEITAEHLLGKVNYQAICYGGYRTPSRDIEPAVFEIKEDIRILAALKIKIVRSYTGNDQLLWADDVTPEKVLKN